MKYLLHTDTPVTGNSRTADAEPLFIAKDGKALAVLAVSPNPGVQEQLAVDELVRAIELMCGQKPKVASTDDAIAAALADTAPVIVLGQEALKAKPALEAEIAAVLKKKPYLRSDGIAVKREGNRIYIAGNNDYSHYYAAAELLRKLGCRWYIPTEIGECIPQKETISVDDLDIVFSSPFEVRIYWISWAGDKTGQDEFMRRNMMGGREGFPGCSHTLGQYVKELSDDVMKVPLTDPNTATHIAKQLEDKYSAGKKITLGMDDGVYDSDYPGDKELMELQWDKYMLRWSMSDPFIELYNNIARILQEKYPDSNSKIGFLLYSMMTIPPVREMKTERSLYGVLAPIDIDPNHGMDDAQSPPRQEYRDMMYKWAKIFDGRLAVYDYDQGMLIWRDLPNPSHQSFRQDIKHYRKAGIMGFTTESRNAIATVFLNLYIRGRLMWDPDEDVDALLDEFYPIFYGPAAEPMRVYWSTIYDAFENTLVTEHEYFAAPAIYSPEVMKVLTENFEKAEQIINSLQKEGRDLTRNEKLYVERMRFTRYSYLITKGYTDMIHAAATECDYAKAAEIGSKTVALREEMTDFNGIFTTYRNMDAEYGEKYEDGYHWWLGEIKQYRELGAFVDGTKGKLVGKLPLEWAFRRDTGDYGVDNGFATQAVDLTWWNSHKDNLTPDNRRMYPDQWEMIRTDVFVQAQGIRAPDRQCYSGTIWYRTEIELTAEETAGKLHIRFPGIFNVSYVYINGQEIAQRSNYNPLWFLNDYRFEWDVDTAGELQTGKNTIAVRCINTHHFGGLFRRPFLYEKISD